MINSALFFDILIKLNGQQLQKTAKWSNVIDRDEIIWNLPNESLLKVGITQVLNKKKIKSLMACPTTVCSECTC